MHSTTLCRLLNADFKNFSPKQIMKRFRFLSNQSLSPPPGEHHPRVQPERTLPEVQEAQQDQRRQDQPITVPTGHRGGGARAAGS